MNKYDETACKICNIKKNYMPKRFQYFSEELAYITQNFQLWGGNQNIKKDTKKK